MNGQMEAYFDALRDLGHRIEVTDADGEPMALSAGLDWLLRQLRALRDDHGKVMFVGNGGSAAIASHMAIDFSKNGGFNALAFNDGAALTCLANDFGYDKVFAKQLERFGWPEDLLFAVSSSGNSENILEAARMARTCEVTVVTLSGFGSDNALRALGDLNFYLPDRRYGFVEIGHLAVCHAVLDMVMGWRAEAGGEAPAESAVA